MVDRRRLPNRRESENFNFTCAGLLYTATVSHQETHVVEIFLNNHKINSHADVSARDAAVVCSIALQYGVPVDIIADALMRDTAGRANGPLGTALDIIRMKAEAKAP